MSNAYYADRMRDFRQTELAFDSFFDEYDNGRNKYHRLRMVARRALARRMFGCGMESLVRGRLSDTRRLIHASIGMDPRLRYRPPALWLLLKASSKMMAKVKRPF
jgi:hypothetical protein